MARFAALLMTFAALAALAGAQGPPPPLSAAERVELFRKNRTLLENLVENGVGIANATNPLARAKGCRATALSLKNSLTAAIETENPDRVAELAELMVVVVRDGLVPNAAEADRTIPLTSRAEREELEQFQNAAAADLDAIRVALPAGGKVGDSEKAKAALATLAGLKDKLRK